MKIVCAPDSYKESMTAVEAAAAMARGVRAALPHAMVVETPLSDGGEGFLTTVAGAIGAQMRTITVPDARERPRDARFAIAGERAIIEIAEAIGLETLTEDDRDVWQATSRGVGALLRAALDAGARSFLIGIGGSATNDGGAGMLAELGVRYLDSAGQELPSRPHDLRHIARVDVSGLDPRIRDAHIEVACDVTNPLLGTNGATAVFGPQKGARPEDVSALDDVLRRVAECDGSITSASNPGDGAAGGIGHALRYHLGAQLRRGIDLVLDATNLSEVVRGADLVFTGEGSVDAQTLYGKTPSGVLAVARRAQIPCVILAGQVKEDAQVLLSEGALALLPITNGATDLATALANGARNLERTTEMAVRLFCADTTPQRDPRPRPHQD